MLQTINITLDCKTYSFEPNNNVTPYYYLVHNNNVRGNNLFSPINVRHDPLPGQHFSVKFYDVLQSIQWHVIRHVFYDRLQETNSLLKNQIPDNEIIYKWKFLLKHIGCNIWKQHMRVKNKKARQNRMEKNKCNECISENGFDKFKECIDLFQSSVNLYLQKSREWITATIADPDYVHCYANPGCCSESNLNLLRRRHVHILPNRGHSPEDIWAFVFDIQSNGHSNYYQIFKILLQKISRNQRNVCYRLKTIYRIGEALSEQVAIEVINKHIRAKLKRPDFKGAATFYCHPFNWK